MHQTIDYIDQLTFPPLGHVTIGEANSSLVHISGQADPKWRTFINAYGEQKSALQVPSRNTPLPEPPVIKEPKESETGFLGATQVPPKPWTIDTVKDRIPSWTNVDAVEKFIRQWGDKYLQSLESGLNTAWDIYNDIRGIEDLGDTLAHLLIRTIAFHPHRPVLAIALWDNSVWIYDLSHKAWYASPLAHRTYQTRVMTLQWKPMSGTILTVGCEAGVSVWHVHRGKYIQDPFSARSPMAHVASQEQPSASLSCGKDPTWDGISRIGKIGTVDQMAWDPRGELLAVSSAQSSTVYIRDAATNQIAELAGTLPHITRSKTSPVGVSILTNKVCAMAWSPSGEHLVVGYQSGVRIFSTATWDAVDITDLGGAVQSACWTPDGHNLIYTLVDDHVIRALHFEKRGGELNWINLNYMTMSLQDKDVRRYKDEAGESPTKAAELRRRLGGVELEELKAFGPVEQVALDPNGERLVVRFRNTDLLGVVLVRPTGTPLRDLDIFMPLGFIRGPVSGQTHQGQAVGGEVAFRDPKVVAMSFASDSESGSLLSLAWESGAITFTPFYYLSQQRIDKSL